MNSAVAIIVFNRPECTAQTLAAIRAARPPRLFVIADGPRASRPDDVEKCAAVRKMIDDGVDWPCVVERDYAHQNLGCGIRPATGLTWAFSRADRLVVLEDDCVPDPSFFWFCDEMLERYATDTRVGQISGCPCHFSEINRPTSYIFSRYGPCWGWASWRRAWDSYDLKMESWPRFAASGSVDAVGLTPAERIRRHALYDGLHKSQRTDVWDYQWSYAKARQGMLSIIPCKNLIENVGFDGAGTHFAAGSKFGLVRSGLERPLRHPEFVLPDGNFDRAYSAEFLATHGAPLWRRAVRKVRRLLKVPVAA
jgi:hypothetical protein